MTKQERQQGTLLFGMNNQQWQECWMDLGTKHAQTLALGTLTPGFRQVFVVRES